MDYFKIYCDIIYKDKAIKYKNRKYKQLKENYSPRNKSLIFKQFRIWKGFRIIEYDHALNKYNISEEDLEIYKFKENDNYILKYLKELYNEHHDPNYPYERHREIKKQIRENKNTSYLSNIFEYDRMYKVVRNLKKN